MESGAFGACTRECMSDEGKEILIKNIIRIANWINETGERTKMIKVENGEMTERDHRILKAAGFVK